MQVHAIKITCAVLVLIFCHALKAQVAKPCLQPTAEVPFTVIFADGSNLSGARIYVQSKSGTPPNQESFRTNLWTRQQSVENGIAKITLTIPDDLATGEYEVSAIEAFAFDNNISKQYAQSDFTPPKPFSVCNPNQFKWPAIKSVSGK